MTQDRAPRQAVKLTGAALLKGGTTLHLTILDLSYDGCKVQGATRLGLGSEMALTIAGLDTALEAVVRWSKGDTAGLQFRHPAEEEQAPGHPPRESERIKLSGSLSLRRPGRSHYTVRMFDLAPTGCKVEFVERPKLGETLWAKFEGLEAIEAVVRWVDGFYGGIEFVRPMHPGVFAILLRKLRPGDASSSG